ncbi:MAG: hypothetical protein KAX65_12035 [Caldilineaceae bacterium]|nr:hypothetical protein [Caldilineaceae bacterium]
MQHRIDVGGKGTRWGGSESVAMATDSLPPHLVPYGSFYFSDIVSTTGSQ